MVENSAIMIDDDMMDGDDVGLIFLFSFLGCRVVDSHAQIARILPSRSKLPATEIIFAQN